MRHGQGTDRSTGLTGPDRGHFGKVLWLTGAGPIFLIFQNYSGTITDKSWQETLSGNRSVCSRCCMKCDITYPCLSQGSSLPWNFTFNWASDPRYAWCCPFRVGCSRRGTQDRFWCVGDIRTCDTGRVPFSSFKFGLKIGLSDLTVVKLKWKHFHDDFNFQPFKKEWVGPVELHGITVYLSLQESYHYGCFSDPLIVCTFWWSSDPLSTELYCITRKTWIHTVEYKGEDSGSSG